MTTIQSHRRLSFGIKCIQCGSEQIAPERAEYWTDRHAFHIWHCPKYCRFALFELGLIHIKFKAKPTAIIALLLGVMSKAKEEVTMTTIQSHRRLSFGTKSIQCGSEQIAPETGHSSDRDHGLFNGLARGDLSNERLCVSNWIVQRFFDYAVKKTVEL